MVAYTIQLAISHCILFPVTLRRDEYVNDTSLSDNQIWIRRIEAARFADTLTNLCKRDSCKSVGFRLSLSNSLRGHITLQRSYAEIETGFVFLADSLLL